MSSREDGASWSLASATSGNHWPSRKVVEVSLLALEHCLHGRRRMEHLRSRAGATGGKRAQIEWPQERLEQAVAADCDRLPIGAHGKEGVDGSSPSEGFRKVL
jgi:hypothetical protein